jgi:hypothetical protein
MDRGQSQIGITANELLFIMVKRILDLLPSKTANVLRLDRFSSCYTDKLHGKSPYENDLKKLLLDDVEGHDTLNTMNDRYRIVRAHNSLSLAYRSAFPGPSIQPSTQISMREVRIETHSIVFTNTVFPSEQQRD